MAYKINGLQRKCHPEKMKTDAYNSCVRNGFRMQHRENRRLALAPPVLQRWIPRSAAIREGTPSHTAENKPVMRWHAPGSC
jgi:hypothetical protein